MPTRDSAILPFQKAGSRLERCKEMHWTEPATAEREKKLGDAANQLWAGASLKPGARHRNRTPLGNFFGLSDRVQRRLVFTNASDVNDTAITRAGFMAVRGGDLDELTASDFANIEAWLDGLEAVRQIAIPDPHQAEAVDAIAGTFADVDRTQALMACGSGKTLVALWTSERLNAQTILILLPSLALVRQTLHQWLKNTSLPRGGVSYRCICSDATVSREMDEIHVRPGDLDFPVTTDAEVLRAYLSQPYAGVKLVFSTYQSTKVLVEATKGLPAFDLGIFDEAHKTAGRDGVRSLRMAREYRDGPLAWETTDRLSTGRVGRIETQEIGRLGCHLEISP